MNQKLKHYSQILVLPILLTGSLFSINQVRAANAGDLIKCPDFDSVYYLAEDGQRYVFQNEKIFHSRYENFDDVATISCNDLASLPIGGPVLYQAGTKLVKIPSDPTVYAIEDDGLLRPIASEEQAQKLYGDDWSDRIDDLDEAFFGPYDVGAELSDDEIPVGTPLEDDSGNLFRLEADGLASEIDGLLDAKLVALLREFALSLTDTSIRLEIEIEIETEDELDDTSKTEIENEFDTVKVDDEDIKDISEIDEIDDNEDDIENPVSDSDSEDTTDDSADTSDDSNDDTSTSDSADSADDSTSDTASDSGSDDSSGSGSDSSGDDSDSDSDNGSDSESDD